MDRTRSKWHVGVKSGKRNSEMAFCQVAVRVTLVVGTGRGNSPRPLFNRPPTLKTTPITQVGTNIFRNSTFTIYIIPELYAENIYDSTERICIWLIAKMYKAYPEIKF